MIELERTFLAKKIPQGLDKCKHKEVFDIYIPETARHPVLRIRKNGEKFEMTKKQPVSGNASEQREQTITLTKDEFDSLTQLKGKRLRKLRYYYKYKDRLCEIDIFQDKFKGLVLVDFEFDSKDEKNRFELPDFCLTEVTLKEFIACGMLAGKSYDDIKEQLDKLNYKKLEMKP